MYSLDIFLVILIIQHFLKCFPRRASSGDTLFASRHSTHVSSYMAWVYGETVQSIIPSDVNWANV